MSKVSVQKFALTTNASGDATVDGDLALMGAEVLAVELIIGTLTSGAADVTLSDVGVSGATKTLLTLTNVSANAMYYPRLVVHGETGTALTGTAGGDRTKPLVTGRLRVTVAQGGNVTSGSVFVWYKKD